MKRITVTACSITEWGGGEQVLLNTLLSLKERSVKPLIVSDHTTLIRLAESLGIDRDVLGSCEITGNPLRGIKPLNEKTFLLLPANFLRKALLFYKITNSDTIFYYKPTELLFLSPLKSSYNVIYAHSDRLLTFRSMIKIYDDLLTRVFSEYLKNIDLIVFNSRYTQSIAETSFKRMRSVVIYPPVNTRKLKFLRWRDKGDVVATVGRFDPDKGYEDVVSAARRLPDVKFHIMGFVNNARNLLYYEKIKRMAPSNVVLLKNATREVVTKTLSEAKVYLHAARKEFFGISVVEAMASGCIPVIYKDGGPWYDICCEGRYCVGWGDVDEMVEAIRNLISEGDLSSYSEEVRRRASEFDSVTFREEIVNVLINGYNNTS
ncbi:MAG: glycosyltransferase [Aigarchaeota archaeon]|nr:glycosyltransferase [Aigarchaeota archaeon]MDW8093045.1 glycosyltransferase [Nitrososphaerota archaeon]